MKHFVFAVYDPRKAALASVWERSWEARGWSTQLLTPKEIEEAGGTVKRALWRRGHRAAPLTDLLAINFSLSPGKPLRVVTYGRRGWKTAPLVRFPAGATEDIVFGCGRSLCL